MKVNWRRGVAQFLALTMTVSGITVTGGQTKEVKADEPNYQLVWSDEFDGNALDKSVWNVEVNGDGGGNAELQYYREENIEVSGGSLKITAKKEDYMGKGYTSGRITTQNKKYFQYGRYEARMKIPSFDGAWPAFWTLGQTHGDLGWPACSEIDIMEAVNTENKIYGTLHWLNGSWVSSEYGQSTEVNNRTDWHIYAMEWDEDEIRWYCDDVKYHTQKIDEADMDEARGAQFILFNLAIGGTWPGYKIDDSAFTDGRATMEVDYVRVYQDPNYKALTYQNVAADSNWHALGNWEINVAGGESKAQAGVDPLDPDHIKVQQLSSTWSDAYILQARYRKGGLTPGEKYKISVDLTSHSTDGQYKTDARDDDAAVSLLKGTKNVTKTAVADANGEVSIDFGLGWVGTTVVLDFANVNCRVYDPNEVEEVSDVMEFVGAIRDSAYHNYGNWQIYVEEAVGTSQAKVAVDESNPDHIQVQHSQVDWGGVTNHAFVRAKYTAKNLTPGETYTLSTRMLTSSADGKYSFDKIDVEIPDLEEFTHGERYVSKTVQADANGEISIEFGFGWVGTGVVIDFDNVSCVKGTTAPTAKAWNYQAAANGNSDCGNWKIYLGNDWSGQTANVAADPQDPDYISVVPLSVDWTRASQWSVQAKRIIDGLTPGKKYQMKVEMTVMGGEGTYMVDNVPEDERVGLAPQVGKSTVTKIAEADENGQVEITFGLGMLTDQTVVNLKLLSCEEYSETQPTKPIETPVATTAKPVETQAPVTEAPQPATTAPEQTQAQPTEAQPTQVQPTTEAPIVNPEGTNLALGKTVTASSEENAGMKPENAVDGDANTRWASQQGNDAEWITVDLENTYAVNAVILNWEAAFGKAYQIQTSLDGNTWNTVKELSNQDGGIDTVTFDAVDARYVRMQGVERGLPYGYSLYEFEVYGAAAGTQPPTIAQPTSVAPVETQAPATTAPSTNVDDSIAAPFGLVYAGGDNLPYYFAWGAQEMDGYNVYVNGKYATTVQGTAANLDADLFETPGIYTISIQAVKGDAVSKTTSITFNTVTREVGAVEQEPIVGPVVITTQAPQTTAYVEPTDAPTQVQPTTQAPWVEPTEVQTQVQPTTQAPWVQPTDAPTQVEPTTQAPWVQPTDAPTQAQPTTQAPWVQPTDAPTQVEPTTQTPWVQPTDAPTQAQPTTQAPWVQPTDAPTQVQPTTQTPWVEPTQAPTQAQPTTQAPTQVQPTTSAEQPTTGVEPTTQQASETLVGGIKIVDDQIQALNNDKDPEGANFRKLRAQVKKSAKTSNRVSWKKQSGATKYVIYGAKCGTKYTRLGIVSGNAYTHTGLTSGTYYKYMVVAQDANGNVLAISRVIHSATKGGKVGNAKSLKLSKKKATLKKGRKLKIKATQIADAKKVTIKKHRAVSFESSNTKIATVSKKGVIKAKSKGKCTIYVFAQNGVYKTVKVTVK